MDLRSYLSAIRRSWLLLVLTTILGAAAGTALYMATPPTYASKVDFYVSTPKTEGTNPQSSGQFAESRVNSYIVLLSSEQLAKRVVASTGIDLSPGQLASKITATAQINTVIVTATVTDRSPQRSLQIAQGVADNFGSMVDDLDNAGRADAIVVINVVSGPTLNKNPVSPDPRLYIGAGLAAGLLLGLAIAVISELLDVSVRTLESAQRLVGAPVLGNIAYDPNARRAPLIVGDRANSVRAESYRHLRTNLQFIDAAKSAHTLLVTSALPLEGKTTTAVNLALAFAESGERVLLIEADLRRPKAAALLHLSNEPGLTNVLAEQTTVAQVVQQHKASSLHLLPSGSTPPNPSELLGSARMADLIASLRSDYDKIVIDSPPVLPVTDALVVSALADAVLLVIRHGKSGRSQVAGAARSLANVGARVVGSVLTMRKTGRSEQRRYGTYSFIPSHAAPAVNWATHEEPSSGAASGASANGNSFSPRRTEPQDSERPAGPARSRREGQ